MAETSVENLIAGLSGRDLRLYGEPADGIQASAARLIFLAAIPLSVECPAKARSG